MKLDSSWRIRLAQILLGGAIVLVALVAPCGTLAQGRDDRGHDLKGWDGKAPENPPVHLTTDWSHRHLVFSTPKSRMKRIQLSSNPRYVQQGIRRNAEKQGGPDEWRWRRAPENPRRLHGDWSMDMGPGATVGAGNYPAKFSFDVTTANCGNVVSPLQPDFVVYNTSLPGSGTQATIVAFDNLYSGCSSGAVPTTYWAYNTSITTDAVLTSPVLSGDGSQVAFIQTTASAATLVILRWAANSGTLTGPATPTLETSSDYYNSGAGCTAPCMTTIPLSTATSPSTYDDHSSPFYDYSNDALYVGDHGGFLHKFAGVFKGTPAEVVSPPDATATIWPANVESGFSLRSPVFDDGTNQIFVGDYLGYLSRVDATIGNGTGGIFFTARLGASNTGIDDAPIVDSTTDNVYVFVRGDTNASQETGVFQLSSTFANFSSGTEAIVSTNNILPVSAFYAGDFDNAYYTSSDGTGNMYVCSTNGGLNALWQIPIHSGVMQAPVAGSTLTSANVACSPVTEFYNSTTATDLIFLSVTGSPLTNFPINCPFSFPTLGCVMSFNITTPGPTNTAAATNVTGGTSGIVVDNSSSASGASQVYFTPLADQNCTTSRSTGGCAIQASQSALQ